MRNGHIYIYIYNSFIGTRAGWRLAWQDTSGRTPNPNQAELRNLVGDLRIARIDPSRGGGIKETRVDPF